MPQHSQEGSILSYTELKKLETQGNNICHKCGIALKFGDKWMRKKTIGRTKTGIRMYHRECWDKMLQ